MGLNAKKYSEIIKQKAEKYGFQGCGISKAGFLEEEAPAFERWLKAGFNGEMGYMENYFDKRLDPTLLVEGAKSVISLSYNYYPEYKLNTENNFKISKYAYGETLSAYVTLEKSNKRYSQRDDCRAAGGNWGIWISGFYGLCTDIRTGMGKEIRNRLGGKKCKSHH